MHLLGVAVIALTVLLSPANAGVVGHGPQAAPQHEVASAPQVDPTVDPALATSVDGMIGNTGVNAANVVTVAAPIEIRFGVFLLITTAVAFAIYFIRKTAKARKAAGIRG